MALMRPAPRAWKGEDAVTAVLGGVLMLALMMTLVPGAVLLKQAMGDEMAAQREASERAAFCARHPHSKVMDCKGMGPLPGYRCEEAAPDVFLCGPEEMALDYEVVPRPPTPSTPPGPSPAPPDAPTPAASACDLQDAAGCVPQGHALM